MSVIDIQLDDVAQMRKQHPCGGDRWRVVRLGAEIGIVCMTCQRRVLLPRATFERRIRRLYAADGAQKYPPPS